MWVVFLLLLLLLFSVTPALAESGFSEKYERDYNILNPASRYAPDNPLNPAETYALTIPSTLPTATIQGTRLVQLESLQSQQPVQSRQPIQFG
jgi:hypothetical protein